LIREVKEETGLEVKEAHPIFLREDGVFVASVYLVSEYGGEISTNESGVVAWITFDDLKQGAFSEYNTKLETHLKFLKII
jgi:8-oxo-dGTP pyrophosphatase MutT (NUDIX family)